jgi:hypothetical protein
LLYKGERWLVGERSFVGERMTCSGLCFVGASAS